MTSDISETSQFYTPYGLSFHFNPSSDYEERTDDTLSDDCILGVPESQLVNYTDVHTPPPCDIVANEKARNAVGDSFPTQALVFNNKGRRPSWDASQGHWTYSPYSNYSGGTLGFVNMLGAGQQLSLAHELGHYFQLPHTFVEQFVNRADLATKICARVSLGDSIPQAYINVADGDIQLVGDTNPDPGSGFYTDACLDPQSQPFTVNCGFTSGTITVNPDRGNIMSYFDKTCGPLGHATLSAGQQAVVLTSLTTGNRRQLNGGAAWLGSVPSVARESSGTLAVVLSDVTGGMLFRNVAAGQGESTTLNSFQFQDGDIAPDSITTFVAGSQIHVLGRTNTGLIQHKTWSGTGWLPSTTSWENLGGTAAGRPVIVSMNGTDLDVFVRFTDNTIRHKALVSGRWVPSGTSWDNLGGSAQGDPAATSWGANRMDMIVRGTDGAIWRKVYTGGWWPSQTAWDAMSGASLFTDSPAMVSWGANRLDMVARGTDGAVWYKAWTGSAWDPPVQTTWRSLSGGTLGSPSITTWGPNRLDIAVRGTDNQVWRKVFTGGWWPSTTGWDSLGGNAGKAPVVFAESVNVLRYYGVGTDGVLYSRLWDGANWQPASGWTYLGRQ